MREEHAGSQLRRSRIVLACPTHPHTPTPASTATHRCPSPILVLPFATLRCWSCMCLGSDGFGTGSGRGALSWDALIIARWMWGGRFGFGKFTSSWEGGGERTGIWICLQANKRRREGRTEDVRSAIVY